MISPIRIRARLKDDTVEAHVLMPHPMETGLRLDAAGAFVAAHYITDVRVTVAGRTVFAARLSRAVSQDPLLHFRFKGATRGEHMSVSWIDSRGEQRSDEVPIT
jgi:sulfur-oxidizing protein SoxZ